MAARAVLFDLDGTLLDTAPDLAAALNRLRAETGAPALPYAAIRPWISHGSHALMRLGFTHDPDSAEYERLRQRLLALYHAHIAEATHLFAGMEDILVLLEGSARPWGIVTNKPGWLTAPLLAATGLATRAACVIAGDTLARSKPYPDPLLAAAAAVGVAPSACLYVGDAESDAQAAAAAGMPCVIARYGYLGPGDTPHTWPALGCIDAPHELLTWL